MFKAGCKIWIGGIPRFTRILKNNRKMIIKPKISFVSKWLYVCVSFTLTYPKFGTTKLIHGMSIVGHGAVVFINDQTSAKLKSWLRTNELYSMKFILFICSAKTPTKQHPHRSTSSYSNTTCKNLRWIIIQKNIIQKLNK